MKTILILLGLLAGHSALAAAPGEMAKRLVELRSEVEEAGNAYEESLQKRKSALEPMQMRHSELEAQVAKEELRRSQLQEKLKVAGGKRGTSASKSEEWKQLEGWAGKIRALVENSVPFRKKERLEKVKVLEERIRLKRESPVTVASDLWNATEKEIQLTKDVEYRMARLPVPNGSGGETEVEIARLGMAHLLYRGPGGMAGFSSRRNGKWELVAARNGAESEAVDRLVSRLKAKSANGWYEIPGLDTVPREEQE